MATESTCALNIVYFGASGAFSLPPLDALLAAGMRVRAVVLPALVGSACEGTALAITRQPPRSSPRARRPALPLLTPFRDRSIASLATDQQIPVFEVAQLTHPLTRATLGALQPDVICVACFPRRLPPALLALPRLGCLNVHPSLLPDNRGPDPLFWTFHRGDAQTGVTIHLMDQGFDTGPILAQVRVDVAPGMSEPTLEHALATMGGALLAPALDMLAAGVPRPTPQDERQATAFGWPASADYVITPEWSARRAYTFACGVAGRSQPVMIRADAASFVVREPLGYDDAAQLDAAWSDAVWRLDGDTLALRCAPGVLRARVTRLEDDDKDDGA